MVVIVVKDINRNIVYHGLYSYLYSSMRHHSFRRHFLYCFCMLSKFAIILKGKFDVYKWLICIMQHMHIQVRVCVFNFQQILAKTSFIFFDIVVQKSKSNVA